MSTPEETTIVRDESLAAHAGYWNLLHEFLKRSRYPQVIRPGIRRNPRTGQEIRIPYTMLKRGSRSSASNPSAIRYEFFDFGYESESESGSESDFSSDSIEDNPTCIGSGGFGKVYRSLGQFCITNPGTEQEQIKLKSPKPYLYFDLQTNSWVVYGRGRVIKIPHQQSKTKRRREITATIASGSAAEKIRYSNTPEAYGILLQDAGNFDLIEFLREKNCNLNFHMRIYILHALFKEVQKLHARGVTHRDLKNRNIVIDDTNPYSPKVTLIDWESALLPGELGYDPSNENRLIRYSTTPPYTAPEAYQKIEPNFAKADEFALAGLAAELMGATRCTFYRAWKEEFRLKYNTKQPYLLTNLFRSIDGGSEAEREQVRHVITGLGNLDFAQRMDIDTAIKKLEDACPWLINQPQRIDATSLAEEISIPNPETLQSREYLNNLLALMSAQNSSYSYSLEDADDAVQYVYTKDNGEAHLIAKFIGTSTTDSSDIVHGVLIFQANLVQNATKNSSIWNNPIWDLDCEKSPKAKVVKQDFAQAFDIHKTSAWQQQDVNVNPKYLAHHFPTLAKQVTELNGGAQEDAKRTPSKLNVHLSAIPEDEDAATDTDIWTVSPATQENLAAFLTTKRPDLSEAKREQLIQNILRFLRSGAIDAGVSDDLQHANERTRMPCLSTTARIKINFIGKKVQFKVVNTVNYQAQTTATPRLVATYETTYELNSSTPIRSRGKFTVLKHTIRTPPGSQYYKRSGFANCHYAKDYIPTLHELYTASGMRSATDPLPPNWLKNLERAIGKQRWRFWNFGPKVGQDKSLLILQHIHEPTLTAAILGKRNSFFYKAYKFTPEQLQTIANLVSTNEYIYPALCANQNLMHKVVAACNGQGLLNLLAKTTDSIKKEHLITKFFETWPRKLRNEHILQLLHHPEFTTVFSNNAEITKRGLQALTAKCATLLSSIDRSENARTEALRFTKSTNKILESISANMQADTNFLATAVLVEIVKQEFTPTEVADVTDGDEIGAGVGTGAGAEVAPAEDDGGEGSAGDAEVVQETTIAGRDLFLCNVTANLDTQSDTYINWIILDTMFTTCMTARSQLNAEELTTITDKWLAIQRQFKDLESLGQLTDDKKTALAAAINAAVTTLLPIAQEHRDIFARPYTADGDYATQRAGTEKFRHEGTFFTAAGITYNLDWLTSTKFHLDRYITTHEHDDADTLNNLLRLQLFYNSMYRLMQPHLGAIGKATRLGDNASFSMRAVSALLENCARVAAAQQELLNLTQRAETTSSEQILARLEARRAAAKRPAAAHPPETEPPRRPAMRAGDLSAAERASVMPTPTGAIAIAPAVC